MSFESELIPEWRMTRIVERLRVPGQPFRLRLVESLRRTSSTPQAMSEALGLSQQSVSKHQISLYRAGMVSRRRERTNVIYALADDSVVAIWSRRPSALQSSSVNSLSLRLAVRREATDPETPGKAIDL